LPDAPTLNGLIGKPPLPSKATLANADRSHDQTEHLEHGLLDRESKPGDGGIGPFRLSIAFVLRDLADLRSA